MSISSLLFPNDFGTASFLFFPNKELKELAVSISVCPKHADAGPSSSSRARTMFIVRSSSSSVVVCCNLYLTKASSTIVEVTTPPRRPAMSWECTRGTSSGFVLVLKQYGRAGGLKASSPYITCRMFILITTGAESDPGMPVRCWASAIVIWHSLVPLLSAPFTFFLDGSANIIITSKPKPQNHGLGMTFSSFSSSNSSVSSVGWVASSHEPCSLCAPEHFSDLMSSSTTCRFFPDIGACTCLHPLGCPVGWVVS